MKPFSTFNRCLLESSASLRQYTAGIEENEKRSRRREAVKHCQLPYLPETPVSEACGFS
jgi:hypothetical protein